MFVAPQIWEEYEEVAIIDYYEIIIFDIILSSDSFKCSVCHTNWKAIESDFEVEFNEKEE